MTYIPYGLVILLGTGLLIGFRSQKGLKKSDDYRYNVGGVSRRNRVLRSSAPDSGKS